MQGTATMSAADAAAHESASFVRPYLSAAGQEALRRSYAATQRILRDQVDKAYAEFAAQPMNEYEQWAQGVPA
jgi:hypothetical protein